MRSIEFPKHQDRKRNVLDNFVFSTRVRLARNLEGIKFPSSLTEKEKGDINIQIQDYIKKLPFEVEIESLDEMQRDKIFIYLSNHIISSEFLKNGRIMAYEINGNWVILINEDDHIRISALEDGYNVKNMYNRLSSILIQLEDEIDFAFDEKFGYLTSSALNFGTGLRLSALVNLYGLTAEKKIEQLVDSANKTGYSIKNIAPGNPESPLFIINNYFSLGISEEELINEFETFLHKLYNLEMDSRRNFFDNEDELDLSIEEILELNKKENIEWNNLVYYISLIDAMNKKHLVSDNIDRLRKMIFNGTDDYLHYKSMIDPPGIPAARHKLFKDNIAGLKFKTRSFQ